MSDHHIFRTMGLPYLFFSCGRWEHYHQPSDTPDKLNYQKMARIAALLGDLTVVCAGTDFPKAATANSDTSAFEIATIRRAFGAALPVVLELCGVRQLEERADLDALIGVLGLKGL